MVVTKEVDLPACSELVVDEVNLSTSTLMTAAPYLGIQCEGINNEFMLCRQETNDPRACIALGKQVTLCAMEVFKRIKKECREEFNQHAYCIDKSSGDYSFKNCRKTQAVFDECMLEKYCLERPDFGYFCRGRVHNSPSKAPCPLPCPCESKVSDPTPSLPDSKPRPPARFGGRFHWVND